MKKVLSCSVHILVISSIFFLGACQKRQRPSPDQTMSGMGPGDLAFANMGAGGVGGEGMFFENTDLEPRQGGMGPEDQIRDLLQPIYFEFDRSTLGSSERDKAMAAADYLRNNPQHRLLVEGHCDWRGTTEYNLGLGDRRASSVRDFLASLGIDGSRVEVLSKGDLEATQGADDQQMGQDRRADLVVLKN